MSDSKEIVMARLDESQYKALEKSLGYNIAPCTNEQAHFLLGVQYVMEKLRKGFVVGGY